MNINQLATQVCYARTLVRIMDRAHFIALCAVDTTVDDLTAAEELKADARALKAELAAEASTLLARDTDAYLDYLCLTQ